MTQKEKLKAKFLDSPHRLSYAQILSVLMDEGYTEKPGKGSHKKNTSHRELTLIPCSGTLMRLQGTIQKTPSNLLSQQS